jgi:hypothetical protein
MPHEAARFLKLPLPIRDADRVFKAHAIRNGLVCILVGKTTQYGKHENFEI